MNCTVLFVLSYAAQHVTKLGLTFIYFSFFPFIFPSEHMLAQEADFFYYLTGKRENVVIKMFLNK